MSRFYYVHAQSQKMGEMICGACQRPIVDGEYRYRDAGDRYVTHHRRCSSSDPEWGRLDKRREIQEELTQAYKVAAKKFCRETGIIDLRDVLSEEEICEIDAARRSPTQQQMGE